MSSSCFAAVEHSKLPLLSPSTEVEYFSTSLAFTVVEGLSQPSLSLMISKIYAFTEFEAFSKSLLLLSLRSSHNIIFY